MNLFDELFALTGALDDAGVPYALAGGLAVAVWGAPRATKDIDLLVRAEDVERAVEAARGRGFDIRALSMTFRDGMRVERLSRAEAGAILTVDFLVVDANTEPVWRSREALEVKGRTLTVASRDGLIAMKAAAARPIDIADIEALRAIDR